MRQKQKHIEQQERDQPAQTSWAVTVSTPAEEMETVGTLPISLVIQASYSDTRVNTDGRPVSGQLPPKLLIPNWTQDDPCLITRGLPASPCKHKTFTLIRMAMRHGELFGPKINKILRPWYKATQMLNKKSSKIQWCSSTRQESSPVRSPAQIMLSVILLTPSKQSHCRFPITGTLTCWRAPKGGRWGEGGNQKMQLSQPQITGQQASVSINKSVTNYHR